MNLIKEGWAASVGKDFATRNGLKAKLNAYYVTDSVPSGKITERLIGTIELPTGASIVVDYDGQGAYARLSVGQMFESIPLDPGPKHPLDLVLLKGTH